MDDDIKVTTGEGMPPEVPPVVPPPVTSQAPSAGSGQAVPQPDFFAPETFAPSPIPGGATATPTAPATPAAPAAPGAAKPKTAILIIGAIAFIGVVGSLAYFVIFPALFGQKKGAVTEQPPANEVSTPAPAAHQSYLVTPPAAEAQVNLSDKNYPTIAIALQNEAFNQLADGQFKEIKISDASGQVPFPDYLIGVIPAATALSVSNWFENDFTALLYYDSKGVWPIYVAKLKAGVSSESVLGGFGEIEPVLELGNMYLLPPGTFSGFKDGKVGSYQTRYSVGTQSGASFNYGIVGDYFVMSTNYDALKSVLPLLGL